MVPARRTTVSAVGADRMLLDGMTAWFAGQPDLQMIFTCRSVDELLRDEPAAADVVVLRPVRRVAAEPAHDIRRLVDSGRRVVVLSSAVDADQLRAAVRAGASGYVSTDHDLVTLAAAIRRIATGRTAYPAEPPRPADPTPADPTPLAPRERELLVAYVSGLTMVAAARRIGVRPSTARTYLERIKKKYTGAGRPTYTKLDLAARAGEDGLWVSPRPRSSGTPTR